MKKLNQNCSLVRLSLQALVYISLAKVILGEPTQKADTCEQKYKFDKSTCVSVPSPELKDFANVSDFDATLDVSQRQQKILDEGLSQLHFENYNKTAIFILGNTGSGKTTLTQILNGNLSQLHAKTTQAAKIIVVDDNDRIGLPTTTSKTLVPEYVVNPDNNAAFYDCPGFDDNRGAETDIAAMFFLNSITEHVNNTKYLFTVTHSSVIPGNDRLDFPLLVTHAARFLLNLSKFNKSIGLVVTKVGSFSENGDCLSDDEIMNGIVGFLTEFHQTLKKKSLNEELGINELALCKREIQFVETILQDPKNDKHPNIWFIRNPPKCGSFDKIPYILEVRSKITDLYVNKLEYSPSYPDDFGFTLKDKTVLKIKDVYVRGVILELENSTLSVVDDVFASYESNFNDCLKNEYLIRDVLMDFIDSTQILKVFTSSQSGNETFVELMQALFETIREPIPETYVTKTMNQERVLRFYEKVAMSKVQRPSLDIPMSSLENKVLKLKETAWKDIKHNHINNKSLLINESVTSLIELLEKKCFQDFYNDLNRVTLPEKFLSLMNLVGIKDRVDEWKQYKYKKNITDNFKMSTSISDLYFRTGNNVPIDQRGTLEHLESELDFLNAITDSKTESSFNRWIEISTDFIEKIEKSRDFYDYLLRADEDFKTFSIQKDLQIQNTTFEWTYEVALQLIQNHISSSGLNSPRFKSGISKTINNQDKYLLMRVVQNAFFKTEISCPSPEKGVVKGNFVKISDFLPWTTVDCEFSNLKELEIYASEILFLNKNIEAHGRNLRIRIIADRWEVIDTGVKIDLSGLNGIEDPIKRDSKHGPPGKHGGNGGYFIGLYGTIINGQNLEINVDAGNGGNGQNGENGEAGNNGNDAIINEDGFPDWETDWYEILGSDGTEGASGGDGGFRGESGNPGIIEFFQVPNGAQEHRYIIFSMKTGNLGTDGKAGVGGDGGRNGKSWSCLRKWRCAHPGSWSIIGCWKELLATCHQTDKGQQNPGKYGEHGKNTYKQGRPMSSTKALPFPSLQLGSYKKWVLQSGNEFGRHFVTKVNKHLGNLFESALIFTEELLNLESLFFENSPAPTNYIYELENLLGRLANYASEVDKPDVIANKNVLNLLNILAYSHLISLREQERPSGMVIDVAGYFETISKDFNKLKSANTANKVSSLSQNFQNRLHSKILEAKELISYDLLSHFGELEKTFEAQASEAKKEINLLHKSAVKHKDKLIKAEKEYQNRIKNQKIMQGVALIGTLTPFLNLIQPNLSLISATANSAGASGNFFGFGDAPIKNRIELPGAIQEFMKIIHKNILQKANFFPVYESTIQKVLLKDDLQQLLPPFDSLKNAYNNLTTILKKLNENEDVDPELIFESHRIFEAKSLELRDEIWKVRTTYVKGGDHHRTAIKNMELDSLIEALAVASEHYPIEEAFQEDPDKHLSPEISEMCDKVKDIALQRQAIYQNFAPIVKTAMANLFHSTESPSGSSSAALEVGKLKIQEMMQDTKLSLKRLVGGLEVAEETSLSVDKLDRTISTIIAINDIIQKYEETKQLGELIVGVISANGFEISSDSQIESSLTKIRYYIQANLLIHEYELAMGAFKQWAFPFLGKYLATDLFQLNNLNKNVTGGDLERVVGVIIHRLLELSKELKTEKTKIVGPDEMRILSYFTSKSVSTKPFYVWKQDQWKNSIDRLLSGESVQLYANIWKSDRKKAAVKFKTIELYLHANDSSVQSKLDENLKHCHLKMTHSGISYYQILSDVYTLKGNNITFQYSFELNAALDPISKTLAVEKLDSVGDYLLSPYTYWTFQLLYVTENPAGFGGLQKFAPFVNLELHGNGMYIEVTEENESKLKELKISENYLYALDSQ